MEGTPWLPFLYNIPRFIRCRRDARLSFECAGKAVNTVVARFVRYFRYTFSRGNKQLLCVRDACFSYVFPKRYVKLFSEQLAQIDLTDTKLSRDALTDQ